MEGRELLEATSELEKLHDSLSVLSLLAHMTDKLGPDCFTRTHHIVDFVQVTYSVLWCICLVKQFCLWVLLFQITLERAVTVLKNTDDEMFGAFENETITMAMGMLTAVMGGASKVCI